MRNCRSASTATFPSDRRLNERCEHHGTAELVGVTPLATPGLTTPCLATPGLTTSCLATPLATPGLTTFTEHAAGSAAACPIGSATTWRRGTRSCPSSASRPHTAWTRPGSSEAHLLDQ